MRGIAQGQRMAIYTPVRRPPEHVRPVFVSLALLVIPLPSEQGVIPGLGLWEVNQ